MAGVSTCCAKMRLLGEEVREAEEGGEGGFDEAINNLLY